jgi:hypothetical protein
MKPILLIAAFFIVSNVSAQYDSSGKDNIKTLFNRNEAKRFNLAPELKLSQINNQLGLIAGLRICPFSNKFVNTGIAGYGLVTNHQFRSNDRYGNDTDLDINLWYAGLICEFVVMPDIPIHFTIPLLLGGGMVNINLYDQDEIQKHFYDRDVLKVESSPFLIIEPGVNMEVSVAKYLRITLGVSYRYISRTDLIRITESDINNLSMNLSFKLGRFNK